MKPFLTMAVMASLGVAALSQTTDNKIQRGPLTPLADHHTHLLSPTAAKLVNDPPLPTIELPEDLARLLREREKGWNDKAALAGLLTEDSMVLDMREPLWIRGRDEVATYRALFHPPSRGRVHPLLRTRSDVVEEGS